MKIALLRLHPVRVSRETGVANDHVIVEIETDDGVPGWGEMSDLSHLPQFMKHLKYVELKNVCCRNLSELRVELRRAKERLRHKRAVILGCIRQPGFVV